MNDKVVFLAYRTDKADTDGKEVLACARCKNKAWTVVYDGGEYPRLVVMYEEKGARPCALFLCARVGR